MLNLLPHGQVAASKEQNRECSKAEDVNAPGRGHVPFGAAVRPNDARTAPIVSRVRPARLATTQQILITSGAMGSFFLVASAYGRILSQVGARNRGTGEFVPITLCWIFIAGWILSPYCVAFMMQRRRVRTWVQDLILIIGLLLMILLEANSFLVTPSLVGGRPHPTADGITIIVIPMGQWAVLAVTRACMAIAGRFFKISPRG